jgi:hypothetical protein
VASKQVTDRQKAADAVIATVDTYGDRLRAGIEATLAEVGGGPESAAAAMVLARSAGRLLTSSIADLVVLDEEHAVELADDTGLRAVRDTAVAGLRDRLVGLRDGLVGLYSAATPGAVGFAGTTPEDPVVLVRFANQVAKALRKDKALPPPRYPSATIDPLAEAAALEAAATALAAAIEAVVVDVRENQVTMTARDAAMTAHDGRFSRTANLLSAMFAFAGEPELADRVRPSGRRPGRLAAGEPAEGEAPVGEAPVVDEAPVGSGAE